MRHVPLCNTQVFEMKQMTSDKKGASLAFCKQVGTLMAFLLSKNEGMCEGVLCSLGSGTMLTNTNALHETLRNRKL